MGLGEFLTNVHLTHPVLGGWGSNFKAVISERLLEIKFEFYSCKTAHRWMSQSPFGNKSAWFKYWICPVRTHATTRDNVDQDIPRHEESIYKNVSIELVYLYVWLCGIYYWYLPFRPKYSSASTRYPIWILIVLNLVHMMTSSNGKNPRYWPLCGEVTGHP